MKKSISGLLEKIEKIENPYLLFSPFLLLYIIWVLLFQSNSLVGDESRFLDYAENLIHGFYATSDITIAQGPGYPLIIMPFVALKVPLIFIKLLNPLFYFLSVVLLFRTLREFVSFKLALCISIFWACYYNSYTFMHLIYSEVFATFLCTLFLYLLVRLYKNNVPRKRKMPMVWSGLVLGLLILTKVIFAYVLVFMLAGTGIIWLFKRKSGEIKTGFFVLLIAFIAITPYMFYTYKITGKIFYFTTNGGENLYWMTSHYEGEYGSWFPLPSVESELVHDNLTAEEVPDFVDYEDLLQGDNLMPGIADSIKSRHKKDFEELFRHSRTGVELDNTFKKLAIRNIKAHPAEFAKNCFANLGRMQFNYPFSYATQKPSTLLRFPLTGIISVLILFCLIPTFLNWKKISFPIRFLLIFTLLYLGGSMLAAAETRMYTKIVPILLCWIAFVLHKSIKEIKINW